MITASEIARRLAERAEDVCRHLLPSGVSKRGEWLAGNINGSAGDSLKVRLTGEKQGVWCDFADSNLKGDMLDLWVACRGIGLKEAINECKDFLNIKDDGLRTVKHVKKERKPVDKTNVRKIDSLALDYLVNHRMISEHVVDMFKVAEGKDGSIAFPYFDEDDNLVMIKYLALDRSTGKKKIFTSPDPIKCLFGKNACTVNNATVVITEGEIDAMSIRQLGWNAVSVPFGAKFETQDGKSSPNDEWISEDYAWLARYSKIVLFMDQDEVGQKAVNDIIRRLGRERCYVARTDKGKDANELLVNGHVEEIRRAIEEAQTVDPTSLKHPKEFRDDIIREMLEANNAGIEMPLGIDFRVRKGELTLWSGFNGQGKSTFLLQTMLHLSCKGEKICIISLEVPPHRSMMTMVYQHMREASMTPEKVDLALSEINDNIWLICHVGSVKWKSLLEEMMYAHMRYGVTQFSIDSMLKCGISGDDYNAQKDFVDALTNFVNETGCHVHLVAHSRKGVDESAIPTKMDLKGSGDISDLCFNGLTVWRNKEKEDKLREAKAFPPTQQDWKTIQEWEKKPDAIVKFWKQRYGDGSEPMKKLFYDKNIFSFYAPQ
jgi:twinkle protein